MTQIWNTCLLPLSSQGGEVTRPLDPTPMSSAGPLPPPLIPLPKRRASDCEPAEEEEGREAPPLPQDLGTNVGLEVGEPEVAAEAYSEMGGSPRAEEPEETSDPELDDRSMMERPTSAGIYTLCSYFDSLLIFFTFWFVSPPPVPSPPTDLLSPEAQEEEFDSLFDSVAEVPPPKEDGPPPLSDNDLAVFDPCYKPGENKCE